ncbi:putative receptor-like protein kinase [Canna indica]|uniref:Receptor-like protein kinase n=1 Tax=Canna indica TaxID=4628 RepID=A0AAQ3KC75_9LILI|nr:putative receptor-like protein kinase [Canna indica]
MNISYRRSSCRGRRRPPSSWSALLSVVSKPRGSKKEAVAMGWDLEIATNWFSKDNILGEGGYGVVYHGQLINGTQVAIKRLLNNLFCATIDSKGQAKKEFRVEVEAIGHVRHKNFVQLLGYCVEGTQRMLVYEYVNNGNLEQWLHGAMEQKGSLTWDARIQLTITGRDPVDYGRPPDEVQSIVC